MSETEDNTKDNTARKRRWGAILPFAAFAALAGLFWYALHTGDPSRLPSALIGKPVPQFSMPPLEGLKDESGASVQSFTPSDLAQGKPTIVNVFASWCVPCLQEHPLLMDLARQQDVQIFAINHRDDAAAARRFLGRHGNPYTRVGTDTSGRTAIEFGVYGVPETFVISGDGTIAYRHVGPLTEDAVNTKILPLLGADASAG